MEAVGLRGASHCYFSALSDQTGGSYRPGFQFLFDDSKPLLSTSLTKFSLVNNNLSSIGGVPLSSTQETGLEG